MWGAQTSWETAAARNSGLRPRQFESRSPSPIRIELLDRPQTLTRASTSPNPAHSKALPQELCGTRYRFTASAYAGNLGCRGFASSMLSEASQGTLELNPNPGNQKLVLEMNVLRIRLRAFKAYAGLQSHQKRKMFRMSCLEGSSLEVKRGLAP